MTPSITLPEPDPIPYPRYEATPAYPVVLPSGESPDPMEDYRSVRKLKIICGDK